MRLRAIGVFATWLVPYAGMAACPDNVQSDPLTQIHERLGQPEILRVRAAANGDARGVFFIDIFGGLMPIPNRFVPFARDADSMNSRALELVEVGIDMPGLTGSIKLGKYSDLLLDRTQLPNGGPAPCETENLERYGIQIEVRRFDQAFVQVLMHDKKEYISLTDNNLKLWEAMLDVWETLRERANR